MEKFPLTDRIKPKVNIVYNGTCSCHESYIAETKRNSEIRWKEESFNNDKKSKFAVHLLKKPGHTIDWQVITSPPHQENKRKILWGLLSYITKI